MNYVRPVLSILVPAFNYPAGLERILTRLGEIPADVEIKVFDDTEDFRVKSVFDQRAEQAQNINYRHNKTYCGHPLGACANWNALIDSAAGEYIILMHHDEAPAAENFLSSLCERLRSRKDVDVWVLDVVIWDERVSKLRNHVPRWLRLLALRLAPAFLFRRNVIGPTATLVVRREIAPRFDPALRALIDVEFYMKLFRPEVRWARCEDATVFSYYRVSGSITAQISKELCSIKSTERSYLRTRYPRAGLWLGAPWGAPIRQLETLAWAVLRAGMLAANFIPGGKRR
jgi:hypothetical protein